MIKELKDRENAFIYGDKPPGMREIVHHYANTEPLTLEKLKECLMELFHKRLNENWGQNILLYKYCAHQNRMVTLSSDPDRNECEMCLSEIIFKPKYELFGKRKKKRFNKVRSTYQAK